MADMHQKCKKCDVLLMGLVFDYYLVITLKQT